MGRKRNEPVRLTHIYTRAGDGGRTYLGDGSRVEKTDPRIAALGAVEEVNSHIGVALAGDVPDAVRETLVRLQNDLFDLGADLAVPLVEGDDRLRIQSAQVQELEQLCDRFNEDLQPLKSFVLPGGTEAAARLHLARTVCRRAELDALDITSVNHTALVYLNRLSDLLFVLARAANAGSEEPLWKPGGDR
jgi:cob(I)alamin adenosyltransferase